MKKGFFVRWISNSLALIIVAYILKGIEFTNITSIFAASLILGIINSIIRPAILFFTLPFNILSLGLFTLVINGAMLYLTSWLVEGFKIQGFLPAIFGALLISIFSGIFNYLIGDSGRIEFINLKNKNYQKKHYDSNAVEADYEVIDNEKN